MPGYTDVFGKPLTKENIQLAIQVIGSQQTINPMRLHRPTRWGLGKASNVLKMLQDAGVVGPSGLNGKRPVLLRGDTAVNAALRLMNKGAKK